MSSMRWEHFPHEADMGIRGIGNTRDEAFEQAALAMTAVITDPTQVNATEMVEIKRQAPDDELLLVDWLNALVYEMATRKLLFSRFEVRVQDHVLTARAWGEPMDTAKHRMAVEIKGATYTALRVAQESNGEWVAQCVVDV
ncbi:MAG: archease [Sulfuricaulis sp.]|uniref:archease n=1 Tax=Sulfuricaulis sp. TaxID=2003553 RepID=UPI0034A0E2F5